MENGVGELLTRLPGRPVEGHRGGFADRRVQTPSVSLISFMENHSLEKAISRSGRVCTHSVRLPNWRQYPHPGRVCGLIISGASEEIHASVLQIWARCGPASWGPTGRWLPGRERAALPLTSHLTCPRRHHQG